MKHLFLTLIIVCALALFPASTQAATYQESVEKINYTHSVQQGGDQPFYSSKDIGSSKPTLQVYIWADLHSHFSQQFMKSTFPTLLEKYGDVARFSYYHHSFIWENPTMMSGIMGECAGQQGFFWENVPVIMNTADSNATTSFVGVNQTTFKECLANPQIKQVVETSNKDAEYLGLNGIPTVIIENRTEPTSYDIKIGGAQSVEIFDQAFQEALIGGATDPDVEDIKQQLVDLETAIKNTQAKVEVVEAEQSRLSQEVSRLVKLVQSLLNKFRGIFGTSSEN